MDNLTHALVGAAMAECALPRQATARARRVFMAAGVVAASAPDIDLAYTWVSEAPLGYLLHHRGHSHTLPGLAVLAAIILGVCRLWPAARAAVETRHRARLVALVAAGVVSHLLLDAANSYGTLLLYPFTSRWYYGDAVFVLEPSLWILLGSVTALNAHRVWARVLVATLSAGLVLALAAFGLVTPVTAVVLGLAAAGLIVLLRTVPAPRRAALGLAVTALVFASMTGLSHVAKAETAAALPASPERAIIDIIANPGPAAPWCWSVLTVERNDALRTLAVRRGTLSLLPGLAPATSCVAHRVMMADREATPVDSTAIVWNREWTVDLHQLRTLHATDCYVRPWLGFGRVPHVDDGVIADLRFDNPLRANFSAMAIADPARPPCPANLPAWTPPRADVLGAE